MTVLLEDQRCHRALVQCYLAPSRSLQLHSALSLTGFVWADMWTECGLKEQLLGKEGLGDMLEAREPEGRE